MASPAKVAKRDEKDDTVKLDVGGSLYTTKMSTLTRYPGSMRDMFSGIPSVRDGPYVIDGDGPIFRHVLNFLRREKLNLPEDFKEWDLLASEADYYGVQPLADAVKEAKCQRVGSEESIQLSVVPGEKYTYIGNSSTLEKIKKLTKFFSCFPGGMPAITQDVHFTYTVKTPSSTAKSITTFEEVQEAIFKEITELGFQAEKQSHTNDAEALDRIVEMSWTFSRRISG